MDSPATAIGLSENQKPDDKKRPPGVAITSGGFLPTPPASVRGATWTRWHRP